ncbi:alpha-2,3-sialyltransferase [Helicobacter cynogastricus]|uniref:alpha-2,3-sialyltransferase n=1 Tax=Helicobacter cynogastricus TaxID=329937 RepID=UPI000CF0987D|nr:alpha-2,3-sialyltransferase [Helicobacter cynogastricus]
MKPLIIAGNGPSIKNLDYSLFPPDFDVFRCNQFYFEDKYYLGKEVKGVFFNSWIFDVQMRTASQLVARDEYKINTIYCTTDTEYSPFNPFYHKDEELPSNLGDRYRSLRLLHARSFLDKHFTNITHTYELLVTLKPFLDLYTKARNFQGQQFTGGIMMLISAIALGYQEIYLAGIDFYATGLGHFYPDSSRFFILDHAPMHTKELDMQAIELAQQYAQLYALIPNSALSAILPLSPHKNALSQEGMQALHLGHEKPPGYTQDILTASPKTSPKTSMPIGRKILLKRVLSGAGLDPSNMIVSFLLDLCRFLRGLVRFFTNKKGLKLLWKYRKGVPPDAPDIGGGGGNWWFHWHKDRF